MDETCVAFCKACQREHTFERRRIMHWLQLGFTVFTVGLWGISWLALCIHQWLGFWECRTCRGIQRIPVAARLEGS